jgi:hypothetical protein
MQDRGSQKDVFEQLFEEVDKLALEVDANREANRVSAAKLAGLPTDEKLDLKVGNVRGELRGEMEKVEKRIHDAAISDAKISEERRVSDKIEIGRLIDDAVEKDAIREKREFVERLAKHLPDALDKIDDARMENRKRKLLQLTPWFALVIMTLGFLGQCTGANSAALNSFGVGVARIR